MSRTTRNKRTVSHGWSVRDDGRVYHNATDRWGDLYTAEHQRRWPKYRRSIYRCEVTLARRIWSRLYRARTNHLVRVGRWDDILPPKRTSGWESW